MCSAACGAPHPGIGCLLTRSYMIQFFNWLDQWRQELLPPPQPGSSPENLVHRADRLSKVVKKGKSQEATTRGEAFLGEGHLRRLQPRSEEPPEELKIHQDEMEKGRSCPFDLKWSRFTPTSQHEPQHRGGSAFYFTVVTWETYFFEWDCAAGRNLSPTQQLGNKHVPGV